MTRVDYMRPGGFKPISTWFEDDDDAQVFYESKRKVCERVVMFEIEESA